MKLRRSLLLAALPLLLLQGCVELALVGAGVAVISLEDRRTTGAQVEDRGIELRTSNRVDDRYGEKVHVNVTSYNRYVLLTGEVPDEATRTEVEMIARGVTNVLGVTNDLQVAGISSMGSRSNDSYLTSKVKSRFLDSDQFSVVHVKVVTEAGVTYLFGVVTEKEAEVAVEIARTTGGVRKVVKMFEYCRPEDEICRPRPAPSGEEPRVRRSG